MANYKEVLGAMGGEYIGKTAERAYLRRKVFKHNDRIYAPFMLGDDIAWVWLESWEGEEESGG